jgi:hypothetical protein
MPAGNVADGIGHGQYGQTKSQGYTGKANADLRKCSGQNGTAAAADYKPECAEKFGAEFFHRNSPEVKTP